MSQSGVTLTSPGGAKVRCTANKRYALAVAAAPKDGKPTLKVLFRTNDPDAVQTRGRREAKRLSRPVMLFRLTDGLHVGAYYPDGTAVVTYL